MAPTSLSRVRTLLTLIALGAALFISVQARPPLTCAGLLDPSFAPEVGSINPFVLDGNKVVVPITGALIRLNEDGSLDREFLVSINDSHYTGAIYTILKDSQNRVLIGGDLYSVNSTMLRGIARFLPGSSEIDPTFFLQGPATNWSIRAIAIQPNGKLVIAGLTFSNYGALHPQLTRVNEDGSPDPTFNFGTGADDEIQALAIQSDGQIVVAGKFKNFDGQPRNQLCRLLPTGELDATFNPARFMPNVTGLKLLPDGKMLLLWRVDSVTFTPIPNEPLPPLNTLVRLLPDGSLDTTFALSPTFEAADNVVIQPDGKYLVSGGPLRRLLPSGAKDLSFNPAGGKHVALDQQSRIVVSVGFRDVNGLYRNGLARLLNDEDACVSMITLATNQISVVETNGSIAIPVYRTHDLSSTSTAQVVLDSTPPLAQRFSLVETNVTFAPGVATQNIILALTDNRILEPAMSFTIGLTDGSPGTIFGAYTRMQINVADASSQGIPGSIDPTFTMNDPAAAIPIGIPWNNKFYDTAYGAYRLYRLLADRSKDPTFAPPLFSTGVTVDRLSAIQVDPDGKVVVAGPFETINGISRPSLARINTDGSVDTSFNAGTVFGNIYSADIAVIFRLPDGSYLIGGDFYIFQGAGRFGLAHFSNSGALLGDFLTETFASNTSWIGTIAAQPDGRILAGGYSSERYLNPSAPNLMRFAADGKPDDSFHPATNLMTAIDKIAVQANGKIIVGGHDGMRGNTMRLNQDGSIDPSFYFNAPATGMDQVKAMSFDSNGNLILQYTYASYTSKDVIRVSAGEYSGPGACEIVSSTALENSNAKVTVRRGWSSQGEVRLRVKTRDATARAGEHYVAIDTSVIFADGESGEKQIEIPLIDNPAIADENLYFEAVLTAETPELSIAPNSNIAKISITDDESGFILSKLAPTILESDYCTFAVRRIGPYTGPATVQVATEGGTAIPGADYEPILQTLTFDSPTNTVQGVYVPIRNDSLPEPGKTIRVVLKNPTGGPTLLAPSTNIFTLDDGADGFAFAEAIVPAVSTQSFVQISVRPLSQDRPNGSITLRYKTEGGSAQPGVDYIATEGFLAMYDEAAKTISIPLLPTTAVGDDATIQVKVTGLNGEPYLANDTATVIIHHSPVVAPAGTIDTRFPALPSGGPSFSDDFIYVATFNGLNRYTLDGTLEGTLPGTFYGDSYGSLLSTPDKGIYLLRQTVMRFDATGKIDSSFQPNLPTFLTIKNVQLADSGKILISGTNLLGGQTRAFILRLLPNGQIDNTFVQSSFSDATSITALATQSDGRILVAGSFNAINGASRNNLARLLPGGELDDTFNPSGMDILSINKLLVRTDGRIVASGSFNISGTNACASIFNTDGSADPNAFVPFPNGAFSVVLAALDVKDRAYFFEYTANCTCVPPRFWRTLPSGARDVNFFPPQNIVQVFSTPAGLLAFEQSPYGGRVIRLFTDPPTILRAPELLPNNRLAHTFNFPANTPYVLEQTEDFITWNVLSSSSTTDGYVRFESPAPNSPSFYRVRSK